ncbi:MAG: hypothetical protein JST04_13210 [Bdellovibrionales bacterium]|nr:hypothetical protein [Bdellovibrionales bacterium]
MLSIRTHRLTLVVAALAVTALHVRPSLPDEAESDESSLVEARTDYDFDEDYTIDEAAESDADLETIAEDSPPDAPNSACLADYVERRKQIVRRALLRPLIAIPVAPGAAYLGLRGGLLVSSGSATANIIASSTGVVAGFGLTLLGLGVHETIQVIHSIDTRRMIELLRDVAANPPVTDGKATARLLRKLEARGVRLTVSELQSKIRELDASHQLCDGTLTGHPHAKRLRKRLLSFHKLAKLLSR